ncbi:hypothetical protein BCR44DRAFT_91569 [Catenaria anguillulae PL171]|uniref:Uncharacterized protein n=1 Tax=Catenaria anguillulae PL171 TaxID=765915 RepID=A0A1Y2H9W0_9FUNG|nr:hypothetical protein BCR44DRAFT_91569 [Catenaria anguillulae PL171]
MMTCDNAMRAEEPTVDAWHLILFPTRTASRYAHGQSRSTRPARTPTTMRARPTALISTWVAAVLGLLAMATFVNAARKMEPVASPLCAPGNAQGGMFGYSVATVTLGNWTWLAVGQPWSSSVHLYRTPFTQVTVSVVNVTSTVTVCQNGTSTFTLAPSTSASSSTASATSTLLSTTTSASTLTTATTTTANLQCSTTTSTKQSVQFSHNLTTPVTWTLLTTLTDPLESSSTGGRPWDGTKDASARSLFGYDISLSADASWLAIGTPGRSFTAFTNLTLSHVSWHPYHGSVVMYQINTNTSAVTYHSELRLNQLPGMSQRYFDRFGSKVRFSPDTQPDRVHLFASANGAWDGVSAPGGVKSNGARPVYGQDVDAGWPVLPTTTNDNQGVGVFRFSTSGSSWQPIQFLRSRSPVPLGTLGIDFAVTGTGARDTVLAVRDYDVTLTPGITNDTSSGMVVIYRQDVNQFTESSRIVGNRLGLSSLIRQEDWFGLGRAACWRAKGRAGVSVGDETHWDLGYVDRGRVAAHQSGGRGCSEAQLLWWNACECKGGSGRVCE